MSIKGHLRYPGMYFRMWRYRQRRRWVRWRVAHGAPIPRTRPYDIFDVWYVNQINKAFGLETTWKAGDKLSSEWWDSIAALTELPTHTQMQSIYGERYKFPSWLLNAAIDAANRRRNSQPIDAEADAEVAA